jgi:hypothetical protein
MLNFVIGEVMWKNLPASDNTLTPIRGALQNPAIRGHGNLVSVTGNYGLRFESWGAAYISLPELLSTIATPAFPRRPRR